jgi:signal transduction histidine kinase/ABC-type nitrate/sulfonate/bicarbonate transport system substrate-binding protein
MQHPTAVWLVWPEACGKYRLVPRLWQRISWWGGAGLLAGLLAILAVGVGAEEPAPVKLDKVVLQLKWRHQFQFAGYYAAVAQGYYRDAGLDVELREAVPGKDPVQAVLAGEAEFGVGTSELLLLRAAGKPVVVLAAIFQHSPLILLSLRQPETGDLQLLSGKPVMIEPQSAELFAYFKYEGIDPAKLQVREHTFNVRDLIEGRVGAMSAYSTDEPFLLKQAGIDYVTFTPRAGGIDFYGDNLFTTEREIERQPARVRAFRQASLRGWDYALAHPAEIIDLILRDYGRSKSREHLAFEAEQTALLMHPGLIEVGHMNPGRWRHIADTYAEFGMEPAGFDLGGFLYDPDPKPNLVWLYWALAILALVTVGALGWVFPLVRLNRHLRQATAEAEAANEAKSRYLAFLTHEIRTPMNGIIGIMEVIKSDALSGDQRHHVEMAGHAAQNLLGLIDNVLDHSKLEAERMELEALPVTLPDFLQGLCELYEPAAQAKGVALRHEIRPGVPAAILSDPVRLRQILANLLSNAVKFTSAGAVELVVEAAPAGPMADGLAPHHRLLFQVRDSGVGIPPEKIGRLFEPFVQSDASVARRFGGSGLGLSISRRLAKLLGGTIRVESEPGRGSVFTLEIVAPEALLET